MLALAAIACTCLHHLLWETLKRGVADNNGGIVLPQKGAVMNIFKLFAGSFHDAQAYRHMRKTESFGLGYAFFVVALTTTIASVFVGIFVYRGLLTPQNGRASFMEDTIQQIAAQVPQMTLQDHRLMTADPVATTITISGEAFGESFSNIPIITIDTTGATTHQNMPTPVVITADDVIMKSDRKTEIKTIKELTQDAPSTLVINRAVAEDLAAKLIAFLNEYAGMFFLFFGAMMWLFLTIFLYNRADYSALDYWGDWPCNCRRHQAKAQLWLVGQPCLSQLHTDCHSRCRAHVYGQRPQRIGADSRGLRRAIFCD
jgi:hypothetical protein